MAASGQRRGGSLLPLWPSSFRQDKEDYYLLASRKRKLSVSRSSVSVGGGSRCPHLSGGEERECLIQQVERDLCGQAAGAVAAICRAQKGFEAVRIQPFSLKSSAGEPGS